MTDGLFESGLTSMRAQIAVEYVPLDSLRPHPNRPRRISKAGLKKLQVSIQRFGFINPVIVQRHTKLVLAGQNRIDAARALGLSEVPVVWVDLDDAAAQAFIVADNRTAKESSWDLDKLQEVTSGLDAEANVQATGFNDGELRLLRHAALMNDEGETEEPSMQAVQRSGKRSRPLREVVRGDVWLLGRHKLMCGDSTSPHDMGHLLGSVIPDVVVYDPDFDRPAAYQHIPPCHPRTKLLVFWNYIGTAAAIRGAEAAGWRFLYEFIWDCQSTRYVKGYPLDRHKACGVFGEDPTWNTEAALFYDGKQGRERIVANARGLYWATSGIGYTILSTVYRRSISRDKAGHKHAKPVDWIAALLGGCGGTTVLDMFGGSGSTILAAERTGHKVLTMEIEPAHCQNIIRRWEESTGVEAARASGLLTDSE